MFDVDGVLTDEHARVDPEVIGLIGEFVRRDAKVSFISGRSRTWMERNLLPALTDVGVAHTTVCFAAEMGAIRRGASTGHEWQVSTAHAVTEALRQALLPLPARHGLEDLVEWDATKEATATFESIHHPDEPGHAARAREALAALMPDCTRLAERYRCRAALSTYALDVLAPTLSKRIGAAFALHEAGLLRGGSRVVVFGDSAGDLAMAETARGKRADARFVWVGRGTPPAADGIPVTAAGVPHAPGTAAFLRSLLANETP